MIRLLAVLPLLAIVPQERGIARLVDLLARPDRRDKAIERLTLLGERAVGPLVAKLGSAAPLPVQRTVLQVLSRMQAPASHTFSALEKKAADVPAAIWHDYVRTLAAVAPYARRETSQLPDAVVDSFWKKLWQVDLDGRVAILDEVNRFNMRRGLTAATPTSTLCAILEQGLAYQRELAAELLRSRTKDADGVLPVLAGALRATPPRALAFRRSEVGKLVRAKDGRAESIPRTYAERDISAAIRKKMRAAVRALRGLRSR